MRAAGGTNRAAIHWLEPPEPPERPSEKGQFGPKLFISSRKALHLGQTGYWLASRVGDPDLTAKGDAGWPVTIEESALSLRTKVAGTDHRRPGPSRALPRFVPAVRSRTGVRWRVRAFGAAGGHGFIQCSHALHCRCAIALAPLVWGRGRRGEFSHSAQRSFCAVTCQRDSFQTSR